MAESITRDEWLRALTEIDGEVEPDAVSTNEFAEMVSIPTRTARDKLTKLVENGRARRTAKYVTNANGHRARVAAYVLIAKPKGKR